MEMIRQSAFPAVTAPSRTRFALSPLSSPQTFSLHFLECFLQYAGFCLLNVFISEVNAMFQIILVQSACLSSELKIVAVVA